MHYTEAGRRDLQTSRTQRPVFGHVLPGHAFLSTAMCRPPTGRSGTRVDTKKKNTKEKKQAGTLPAREGCMYVLYLGAYKASVTTNPMLTRRDCGEQLPLLCEFALVRALKLHFNGAQCFLAVFMYVKSN